jgi:hypothetical protein
VAHVFLNPLSSQLTTTVGSTHLWCSFTSTPSLARARDGHVVAPRHHTNEGRGQPRRHAEARVGHATAPGRREGKGDEGQACQRSVAQESHGRKRKETEEERKGEFYGPTDGPYLIMGKEFLQSARATLPYNLHICFHNLLY